MKGRTAVGLNFGVKQLEGGNSLARSENLRFGFPEVFDEGGLRDIYLLDKCTCGDFARQVL